MDAQHKLSELIEAARYAVDALYAEGLVTAARSLELAISEACRPVKVRKPVCDWCNPPGGIECGGVCAECTKEEPE
jgi:hypothetical protein